MLLLAVSLSLDAAKKRVLKSLSPPRAAAVGWKARPRAGEGHSGEDR